MYLHIGQDTVVRLEDVIGIFDIETSSVSKTTRSFLGKAEKDGNVVAVNAELPKSFVLCREKARAGSGTPRTVVYISQISSTTLLKRSDFLNHLSHDESNIL